MNLRFRKSAAVLAAFLGTVLLSTSALAAGSIYINGSRVGEIASNGYIYKNGSRVGEIASNGTVYKNGSRIGEVTSSGVLYLNGSRVGEVPSSDRVRAAAYYFFFW